MSQHSTDPRAAGNVLAVPLLFGPQKTLKAEQGAEHMSADDPPPSSGDATRTQTLETFIKDLSEIAPNSKAPISARSHLIADLGFDARAFRRLALLLYTRYGVAGLSTASLRFEKHFTVEGFFHHCVLQVLGADRS